MRRFPQGIPETVSVQESIFLVLTGGTARPASEPVTFAELVNMFDATVAARSEFLVTAGGHHVVGEFQNPTGAAEASTSVTGTFRLTSVQCRTPLGKLERLASMLRGGKA